MRESKPTIYDPNFLPNMIYSGVPSWLNLSVIENDEDLKKIDAAVVGVPWEGGCTIHHGRPKGGPFHFYPLHGVPAGLQSGLL